MLFYIYYIDKRVFREASVGTLSPDVFHRPYCTFSPDVFCLNTIIIAPVYMWPVAFLKITYIFQKYVRLA